MKPEELLPLAKRVVALLEDEGGRGMATWHIALWRVLDEIDAGTGISKEARKNALLEAARELEGLTSTAPAWSRVASAERKSYSDAAAVVRGLLVRDPDGDE